MSDTSNTVALEKVSGLSSSGETIKIMGISAPLFIVVAAVVFAAIYMNILPSGMVGAFPAMMVIGAVLNLIGNKTPVIKDYLGGGPIVVIFGTAALFTYNILPESTGTIMIDFMKGGSTFLSFYIAALITGSILGMNRNLLIKAAVRYLPAIIGGVALSIGLVGLVGALIGYGAKDAIFYIAIPIMGGGMGAGAVPLSSIFGDALNVDPKQILSVMIPALALGNVMSIVLAGILNKLGKRNKKLTGDGKLMRRQEEELKSESDSGDQKEEKLQYSLLGIGLLLSATFFIFGGILAQFIPIHKYALMIITVAIIKVIGVLPEKYEVASYQWYRFIMSNLTPALLVGIGVAYTDLPAVISAFTPQYLLLVTVTVFGAAVGSGLVGSLLGFYPIESAITAGLCMANMGGTGDVAVLSASKRMELMPFAQISSRIGGAFMLILATLLLSIFAG